MSGNSPLLKIMPVNSEKYLGKDVKLKFREEAYFVPNFCSD